MTTKTAISTAPSQPSIEALNQLISLVSGRDIAIATNDLASEPDYRLGECFLLATKELNRAVLSNDMKALRQCQRKMESLNSLRILSSLILNETN